MENQTVKLTLSWVYVNSNGAHGEKGRMQAVTVSPQELAQIWQIIANAKKGGGHVG